MIAWGEELGRSNLIENTGGTSGSSLRPQAFPSFAEPLFPAWWLFGRLGRPSPAPTNTSRSISADLLQHSSTRWSISYGGGRGPAQHLSRLAACRLSVMPHHARQRPGSLHQKPPLDPDVFARLSPPSPASTDTSEHPATPTTAATAQLNTSGLFVERPSSTWWPFARLGMSALFLQLASTRWSISFGGGDSPAWNLGRLAAWRPSHQPAPASARGLLLKSPSSTPTLSPDLALL